MSNIKVAVPDGKYVVAVSGGVDSVVLLDLLANPKNKVSNCKLIVAHYDHGIRKVSHLDEKLVKKLAQKYKLKYESQKGNLGKDASEALARLKRYEFLNKIKNKHKASAIVTAHHQDDVIETAMINIIRGTGRRGISSLANRDGIIRPLLNIPKSQIIEYAKNNKLVWNEDETNLNKKFLRNRIRIDIVAKLSPKQRREWLDLVKKIEITNKKINQELNKILKRGLHKDQAVLRKDWFIMLPHTVSKEVIVQILGKININEFDKKTIERTCIQIKVLPPGKIIELPGGYVQLTKRSARFVTR